MMIRYRLAAVVALAAAAFFKSVAARAETTILSGKCDPGSNFASGSINANLDEHGTPFPCDSAVITFPRPGRILIQFVQKSNERGDLIGFAGDAIDGGEVDVDHLYMNDGRTLDVTRGHCESWLKPNGSIKSLICGARVERGDIAIAAVVRFVTGTVPRRPKR